MKFLNVYLIHSFLTFLLLFVLCYHVDCQDTSPNATTTTLATTPDSTTSKVTEVRYTVIGNVSSNVKLNETVTSPPPQKPLPALEQSCNDDTDCKAEFSKCINTTCTCQAGYIHSKENLRCLKVMTKLGDGCSEDEQCSQGNKAVGPTTCLNFICSCAIGMSLIDDKCQGPKVLNTKCSVDDDCTIMKSHCKEGLCMCYNGFIPNSENNKCLPLNLQLQKLSGSPNPGCTEDVQCQETMGDQAMCEVGADGGTCKCQPSTHLVRNVCQQFIGLGKSCLHDIDCVTKDVNTEAEDSRICNNDVCKCNTGWTQLDDNICQSGAAQQTVAALLLPILMIFCLSKGSTSSLY